MVANKNDKRGEFWRETEMDSKCRGGDPPLVLIPPFKTISHSARIWLSIQQLG